MTVTSKAVEEVLKTDLSSTATWTSINGPYPFDGYFYQYREPLGSLQRQQFFRLRKP